jgi:hypothetical protein
MATGGQHIQMSAMSKYNDYSQMNYDGTGIRYKDDYVIMPTDASMSLWSVRDVFGRDVLPGRFTTPKLAKEFIDRHLEKQQEIERTKEIEREENERREFDNGNT